MMLRKLAIISLSVCFCLSVVSAGKIYTKCGDTLQCIEQEFVEFVDGLDRSQSVPILGDFLVLEKIPENTSEGRSGEGLYERCLRFLTSHELKLGVPEEDSPRSVGEPRTRKLKRLILPLLILIKVIAVIVIPAVLSLIAFVAFRGLEAGLAALAVAGAVGFKTLLDSNHHHTSSKLTYEVVPHLASPPWSRAGIAGIADIDPMVQGVQGYHTLA